jgi:hypothetical protein
MYNQLRREHDIIKKSKEEVVLYRRARAEIIDNENLIKSYHDSYESLGKKYQDALERIAVATGLGNSVSPLRFETRSSAKSRWRS